MRHVLIAQMEGQVNQALQGAQQGSFQVAGKAHQVAAAPVVTTSEQVASTAAPVVSSGQAGVNDAVANSILGSTMSGYFEMMGYLLLVLAGVWLLFWLLRRSGVGFFSPARQSMAVESRLSLGPKKWMIVARVHGKRLVLGVTDHAISLLGELPEDAEEAGGTPQRQKRKGAFTLKNPLTGKLGQRGKDELQPSRPAGQQEAQPPVRGKAASLSADTPFDDFEKIYLSAQAQEEKK